LVHTSVFVERPCTIQPIHAIAIWQGNTQTGGLFR
jgi:hypothetical protein